LASPNNALLGHVPTRIITKLLTTVTGAHHMPQKYLMWYEMYTVQYITARSSTMVMTNVVQPLTH